MSKLRPNFVAKIPQVYRFSLRIQFHFFCYMSTFNLSSRKYAPKNGIEVSYSRLLRTVPSSATYWPSYSFTFILLSAYVPQFNTNFWLKQSKATPKRIIKRHVIFFIMFYNKLYIGLYYSNKLSNFQNRSQKHKREICLRNRMIADEQDKSEVPSYIQSVTFSVCWLVQPFYSLSLHPFSQTLLSGNKIIFSPSVLFAVLPSTDILSSIWPMESSSSVFFVIDVLTLIFSSIGPLGLSVAVHLVVLPLALVFSIFAPYVNTQVKDFLPFPWIQLLRNYPSQQLVSKNLRIPLPVFVPFLYYPSYFSPSGHYYTPNPFCLSSFHSPTYLAPFEWVYVPYPFALSLSHYPQQISPSEWQRIPFPLALLLVHQPTYLLPSAQVWVPLPSLIPFFHQPQQVMPLSSSTGPSLVIYSPLKVDWMSWLSFWVLPRSSKFALLSSNLRFLQVYGSGCCSLLYFSPAAAAASSYYFCSSFRTALSGLSLLVYFAGSCSFLAYSCGMNSSFYTVLQLQFSLSKTSAFRLFQICFFSLGSISSGDFSTFAQAPIQTPISLQKLQDQ